MNQNNINKRISFKNILINTKIKGLTNLKFSVYKISNMKKVDNIKMSQNMHK